MIRIPTEHQPQHHVGHIELQTCNGTITTTRNDNASVACCSFQLENNIPFVYPFKMLFVQLRKQTMRGKPHVQHVSKKHIPKRKLGYIS